MWTLIIISVSVPVGFSTASSYTALHDVRGIASQQECKAAARKAEEVKSNVLIVKAFCVKTVTQ